MQRSLGVLITCNKRTEYLCGDKGETAQELDSMWWLDRNRMKVKSPKQLNEIQEWAQKRVLWKVEKYDKLGGLPPSLTLNFIRRRIKRFQLSFCYSSIKILSNIWFQADQIKASPVQVWFLSFILLHFFFSQGEFCKSSGIEGRVVLLFKILNRKTHPRQPLTGSHQGVKSYKCLDHLPPNEAK